MLRSAKSLVASVVQHVSYVASESARRAKQQHGARIIMFHVVGYHECPTAVFAETIQYLRRHFEIVPLTSLVERLRNRDDLTHRVALTFDDGCHSTGAVAYPILKQFGVPATVFVCPGLTERRAWMWNQECRCRLLSLPHRRRKELADSLGLGHGRNSSHQIVEWMKRLPTRSRQHVETIVHDETTSYRPTPLDQAQNALMTWEELRALDPNLITIGAHSTNHPILAHCTQDELIHEIGDCRALLESRMQRSIDLFCYPNGEFNPAVNELVRKHYGAAVTTDRGTVNPNSDPCLLPRISCAPNLPLFAWRLFRPTA